jgi:hypothetical protein
MRQKTTVFFRQKMEVLRMYNHVVKTKRRVHMDNRLNQDGRFQKNGLFGGISHMKEKMRRMGGEYAVRGGGWLAVAFILGICRLPFSVYPLGLAVLCASDTYLLFVLTGLFFSAFYIPIPIAMIFGTVLFTLAVRVITRLFVDIPVRSHEGIGFRDIMEHIRGRLFCESLYLRMMSACVSSFMFSMYSIIAGGFRYYDVFGAFFSMLCASFTTFFCCSFLGDMPFDRVWIARIRNMAKVVLAGLLCLSLGQISTLGFSVGMTAAFAASLIICRREGMIMGFIASLVCGLVTEVAYFPLFPAAAITAFCLFDFSPYLASAVSCMVGLVTGVLVGGRDRLLFLFLPLIIGAAVYCIYEKLFSGGAIHTFGYRGDAMVKCGQLRTEGKSERLKKDMQTLGRSLDRLSEKMLKLGASLEEDKEQNEQRDGCKASQTDIFAADYRLFANMLHGLEAYAENLYRENRQKTIAVRDKLRELGFDAGEVSVCREEQIKIYVSGLFPPPDHKRLIYLQKQLGKTLDCSLNMPILTVDGDRCFVYAERAVSFDVTCGTAYSAKDGVSGDFVKFFEHEERHTFYVLLCDGMGSGREAALTSGISAEFLEKLLCAGVERECALGALNSFLTLGRNGGGAESSNALDLLCLDKLTGHAVFLKSGAAATYVKRGSNIFKLNGASLPLGILGEVDVKQIDFKTRDGDVIVQVSDGVTGGESDCLWLLEYLTQSTDESPKEMAQGIKENAQKNGSTDDISVAVTKISQKN